MRGRLLAAALGMPLEMVRESLIGLAERGLIADATGDEPSAGPAGVEELRGVEDDGFVPDAPADVAVHLSPNVGEEDGDQS